MTAHPIDTEALRRLADAAITPAPWVARTQEYGGSRVYGANGFPLPGCFNCGENDAVYESGDGEFIAAARTALPALLDENAALRARIDAVRELHQHGGSTFGDGLEDHTPVCADCLEEWPCPTIRALDGTLAPPDAG